MKLSTQVLAPEYGVLYVDDEEDNLLVFRSNLADDFTVHTCRSGEEALRVLEEEPVAVVLTDQRMPGMTGVDLCERVRDEHPSVRRLLITAFGDQQTAMEAINRGGVHGFLVKPWDEAQLRRVLHGELERVHLARELTRLRTVIQGHEQELHLASVRDRLLHDVANVTFRLNVSSRRLADLLTHVDDQGLRGEDLEKARACSQRMRSALDHLMAIHKAPRGSAERPRPERVPLAEITEVAQALAGRDVPSGRVRTHLTVSAGAVAWADRVSLTRILVNLLTNAAQAIEGSGHRGRIHLDARVERGRALIDVIDTGPGVPPGLRDKIFEDRFTTRAERGGSGLGLSSARTLAIANGGSLQLLDSPRGAHFRLALPAWPARDEAAPFAC